MVTVNQSDWVRVLSDMGYRDILLLEVPIVPDTIDPDLAAACQRMKKAHTLLIEGHYDKAAEQCRHVMEAVGTALQDGEGNTAVLIAALKDRDRMTKIERIMALRRAIFTMSCLAAHSKGEVALTTTWSRHDAVSLVSMTAALLGWVVEEHLR